MGKRSQAKHTWLTMSQRQARGQAQSGARLLVVLSKAQKVALRRERDKARHPVSR